MIVPSDDGFLHILDGEGRADAIDLGEASAAQPLAAGDLNGDGLLDLVLAASSGKVYAFELPHSRYHPLKAQAREGADAARYGHAGIYAVEASRDQSVSGKSFVAKVELVDARRRPPAGAASAAPGPYSVSVTLIGHRPQRALRAQWEFDEPGSYTLMMDSLQARCTATVRIEMRDGAGARYADEFPASFHMVGYRALKFLVAGPLTLMAVLCSLLLSSALGGGGDDALPGAGALAP